MIFEAAGQADWYDTYAWVPTLDKLDGDIYKVYFAGRNKDNLSQVGYFVIDINRPSEILNVSQKPVVELGPLGTFDDSAVLPCWIVNHQTLSVEHIHLIHNRGCRCYKF